jgi:hypothetical protein
MVRTMPTNGQAHVARHDGAGSNVATLLGQRKRGVLESLQKLP